MAEAHGALAGARAALVAKNEAALAGMDKDIAAQQQLYESEIAGKGPSHTYGLGPMAKAMLERERQMEEAREQKKRECDQAVAKFDRLAEHWESQRETLESQYGLKLPKSSILQNRQALAEIRKRPEFEQTELRIQGVFGFIFLSILTLKLFEHWAVRDYLSDHLQQAYADYLAGLFGGRLEEGWNARIGFGRHS